MSEMSKRPVSSYSSFKNAYDRHTIHDKDYRILVIGKSGNGKSSVCNTILGRDDFQTGCSLSCTTTRAGSADTFRNTARIRIVDTPDITNCNMTRDEMKEEVSRWRTLVSPEVTAVLLTVRCDVRYTAEEYDIYRQIKSLLGDDILKNRLIVAFTFGDRQDREIKEELRTVCKELKNVLKEAGSRYIVFYSTIVQRDVTDRQIESWLAGWMDGWRVKKERYSKREKEDIKNSDRLKEQQKEQLMNMIDNMTGSINSSVRPVVCYVLIGLLVLLTFGCIISLILKSPKTAITCGVLIIGVAVAFAITITKNKYC